MTVTSVVKQTENEQGATLYEVAKDYRQNNLVS